MDFQITFIGIWLFLFIASVFAPNALRLPLRVTLPAAFLAALAFSGAQLSAAQRLILTTVGMLYVFKSIILLRYQRDEISKFSFAGLLVFMTIWPGMDPEPFKQCCDTEESGERFSRGFLFLMFGFLFGVVLSAALPILPPPIVPWLGLISILCMLHLGYAEILTTLVRLAGWDVKPLFNEAYKATSLGDFWSKRWNVAFVDMDKILFLRPLRKVMGSANAILVVFLISGVLHELAISYAAFANWGGPFVYFLIQGMAFIVESKVLRLKKRSVLIGRLWTWLCILVPLPLLFTPGFQTSFITPLFSLTHDLIAGKSVREWFSLALWCAAVGNFTTIGAGSQAPIRLKWKEEFAALTPFTRKIIWTYYGYIGLLIVSWGTVTFLLHEQLLNGEKTALYFAFIIGIFWGVRVIVDMFSFGHKGWPKGADMIIGHACLFSLFCALAGTYWGLIIWHWTVLF